MKIKINNDWYELGKNDVDRIMVEFGPGEKDLINNMDDNDSKFALFMPVLKNNNTKFSEEDTLLKQEEIKEWMKS